MTDADETIITRFLVEADEAIEGLSELRPAVDEVKERMMSLARTTKESVELIKKELDSLAKEKIDQKLGQPAERASAWKKWGTVSSQALKEVKQEAKQTVDVLKMLQGIHLGAIRAEFQQTRDATVSFLNTMRGAHQATQSFTERIGNLGSVVQYVIGGSLAYLAVKVLRTFLNYLKEATQAAIDFTQSMFQLQIAVRGLQRVGVETTIKEFTDFIKALKKEFPIFSRRDITDAVALATLMTREFGFTADQIKEVVRLSTLMSIVTGKDLTEAVQGATYAISAGYFEALQRVGVNITRQTISERALAAGYKETYNALDPTIRATLTLAEIVENLAALEEDAGHIANIAAGQQRSLSSAWEDFTLLLGQNALPTIEKVLVAMTKMVEKATIYLELLAKIDEETKRTTFTAGAGRRVPFLPEIESELEDLTASLEKPREIGGVEISEKRYQELLEATQELNEEMLEIEEEWNEKRIDSRDKFAEDLFKQKQKHDQKMLDLEEDYQQRLDDIALKAQQKRDDAIDDYGFRVAEAIRDAAFRREEAERKYRERELKEEKKFQEKLRQLRENFLLDLEDAVRERDARQIIRLTRQYNLRRTQMIREEKLGKDDRQAQFQEELRQIEFQRQERLRQLAIEHARRLEEIDLQAQRERDRAKLEFDRRQDAEDARWDEEQIELKARFKERNDAIDEAAQDRTDRMIESLRKEYNLTVPELEMLDKLYRDFYGFNGRIPSSIQASINKLQELRMMMATVAKERALFQLMQAGITNPALREEVLNAGEQAEGGTIIARKPTVAIFGEAGPEMAQFTPLNRLGANVPSQITPMNMEQMSRSGRIRLEMLLSPDLEAKIIDNTLGEIADVNFSIERARK